MVQPAPDSHRLERIGDFILLRVIGEGGMGTVYEATERLSGRRLALKVLHASLTRSADARARFLMEMRILANLEHPNIVRSLLSAEIDGRLVLALEYLEGRTLRQQLEQGRLSVEHAIAIAIAVGSALDAAHRRDPPIVHRDLKPENLMLLSDGTVKVMDFGVAKVLSGQAGPTRSTDAIGTVQYMAPEQAEGRAITPRTDLYALGLVLYEMLVGKPPFEAASLLGLLRMQCEIPPPPFEPALQRSLPPGLEALVFQLLAKSPDERPQDAASVLRALQAVGLPSAPGLKTPESPSGARQPRLDTIALLDRFEARRSWKFVTMIALGLALAAGSAIGIYVLLASGRSTDKSPKRSSDSLLSPSALAALIPPRQVCDYGEQCREFHPVDPSKVNTDVCIAEAKLLAVQMDPTARLALVFVTGAVTNGLTIDLTRKSSMVTTQYQTAGGALMVNVQAAHVIGMRLSAPLELPVLVEPFCSYERAMTVALAANYRVIDSAVANLAATATGETNWSFSSTADHVTIEGPSCTLSILTPADRPRLGR